MNSEKSQELLKQAIVDALERAHQLEGIGRSRPLSLIITKLEEAQLWATQLPK